VCGEQLSAGALSLMKLRNVQHLFTPIVGRVDRGRSILDLVARLHPTPAMGGFPREPALEIIRRFEGMDRGWYAAPVGWMDARGEGEFAVAIRSALLHGAEATLFAGCGLVVGSDPEREYAESCLKLRPVLAALGGE
jgi:menaquinone-specific isochorismate synthase